ncbi:hypothetical protein NIES2104_64790 [Leptolyngbya sp. NIES-2104]|nr:hypothetical protein NIES2104_64790 [Leptolyngbya sp. NIES-2104]
MLEPFIQELDTMRKQPFTGDEVSPMGEASIARSCGHWNALKNPQEA